MALRHSLFVDKQQCSEVKSKYCPVEMCLLKITMLHLSPQPATDKGLAAELLPSTGFPSLPLADLITIQGLESKLIIFQTCPVTCASKSKRIETDKKEIHGTK